MRAQKGDKVRLRGGGQIGARGVIERIAGDRLVIRLDGHKTQMRVPLHAVTNLSLAARKAWLSMPARDVGRPKGSTTVDRISVTFRIDTAVWREFLECERRGQIRDRTALVNTWFKKRLTALKRKRH